jgi:hypothetical protein
MNWIHWIACCYHVHKCHITLPSIDLYVVLLSCKATERFPEYLWRWLMHCTVIAIGYAWHGLLCRVYSYLAYYMMFRELARLPSSDEEPARNQRKQIARGFFYLEYGGDTFLRNVGSHKNYTAPHLRKRHFWIRYNWIWTGSSLVHLVCSSTTLTTSGKQISTVTITLGHRIDPTA